MFICRTEPRRFAGRTSRSMNRSRLPFQSPILPNPPAGLWGSSAARLSSRGPQRAPGAPPWPYRASPGIGMGEHHSAKTGNSPLYTKTKRFASPGGHGEPSGALVRIGTDELSALLNNSDPEAVHCFAQSATCGHPAHSSLLAKEYRAKSSRPKPTRALPI